MLKMKKLACGFLSVLFLAVCMFAAPNAIAKDSSGNRAGHKSAQKGTATAKKKSAVASKKKKSAVASKSAAGSAGVKAGATAKRRYGRVTSVAAARGGITARSVFVMDAVSGEILYSVAPEEPRQPASTIKVLTGLIAIDSLRQQDMVRASSYAASMPRSKIYLRSGASYEATDLINAVLLASANDASVALAEKIGGSESGFARLMTAKAESLGARRTVCKTASGLTAAGQQSTARDLAVIFNGAMKDADFARRMSLRKVQTSEGGFLYSHNRALWQVDGAEGGKTGYTDVARKTYVGKFARGNDQIVVALMGSENMWVDVKQLVEQGFRKKKMASSSLAALISAGPSMQRPKRLDEAALPGLTLLAGGNGDHRL